MHLKASEEINGALSADRTETSVTISVLDINDNPPVFNNPEYYLEIDEYTTTMDRQLPSLNMIVSDRDLVSTLLLLFKRELYTSYMFIFCTIKGFALIKSH